MLKKENLKMEQEISGLDYLDKSEINELKSCRVSENNFQINPQFYSNVVNKYFQMMLKPYSVDHRKFFIQSFLSLKEHSDSDFEDYYTKEPNIFFSEIVENEEIIENLKQRDTYHNFKEYDPTHFIIFRRQVDLVDKHRQLNGLFSSNEQFDQFDIIDFKNANLFAKKRSSFKQQEAQFDIFLNFVSDENTYTFVGEKPLEPVKMTRWGVQFYDNFKEANEARQDHAEEKSGGSDQ